jgi:hypothetical protein
MRFYDEAEEKMGEEKKQILKFIGPFFVLTHEMRRYEYEISPRGHISYSAPAGFHDDGVMALALANHRRWETESCGPMLPLAPKGRFLPFVARPWIMAG